MSQTQTSVVGGLGLLLRWGIVCVVRLVRISYLALDKRVMKRGRGRYVNLPAFSKMGLKNPQLPLVVTDNSHQIEPPRAPFSLSDNNNNSPNESNSCLPPPGSSSRSSSHSLGLQPPHQIHALLEIDPRAIRRHVLARRDAEDSHAAFVGQVVEEFGGYEEVLGAASARATLVAFPVVVVRTFM